MVGHRGIKLPPRRYAGQLVQIRLVRSTGLCCSICQLGQSGRETELPDPQLFECAIDRLWRAEKHGSPLSHKDGPLSRKVDHISG